MGIVRQDTTLTPNCSPTLKAEDVIRCRPPSGGDWGCAVYASDKHITIL